MMEALVKYDVLIGLEVHAQLNTKTKIWCGCEINVHAAENTTVCEICSGQPGTLPTFNKSVVELATKVALATNCKINHCSYFDRKNYFYPDMPKGYQITQHQLAIAGDGFVEIVDEDGIDKKIRIKKIQLEEDSGKLTHLGQSTLVNLNRAGVPLIEVVGEPDLKTPKEAIKYLKNLHVLLNYLEVSKGQLQDGNFRCDVNISLQAKGSLKGGVRTETKNLNSFKNIEKAIEIEIIRQAEILDRGDKVLQVTLNFDADNVTMNILRAKSNEQDYRYFPEADLMPIYVTLEQEMKWQGEIPELPVQKMNRFVLDFKIPGPDAKFLTSNKELANYFEEVLTYFNGEPKKVSNWIMSELLRLLNEENLEINDSPIKPIDLAELLNFINDGELSGKQAKEVFLHMFTDHKQASQVIKDLGLKQVKDTATLEMMAQKIVEDHPEQRGQYHSGNERIFGFFIGLMMKETNGQASPQLTNEIMKNILDKNR